MKSVSIINFKGGVGKTTLAFHLACFLARTGRVLVVDVDHQSSLSIVLLGGAEWESAVAKDKSCNTIFASFCTSYIPMPGNEIISQNPLSLQHRYYPSKTARYNNLDLVCAQFELDDTEIDLASTTVGGVVGSEWEKRTLLARWLDAIKAHENYDYVVFDCPPATKLVSQNAIAASNYYVMPVVLDEMSSRGVTHFRNLVSEKIDKKLEFYRANASVPKSRVPSSYRSKTKLVGIAPFLAKPAGRAASGLTNIHTETLDTLRYRWKTDVLDTVVKNLTGVPESTNVGWPVWDRAGEANVTRDVRQMMEKVCSEILDRMS